MKKFKILSLIIAVVMVLSSFCLYADETIIETAKSTIEVIDVGHGEFKLTSSSNLKKSLSPGTKEDIFKCEKISDYLYQIVNSELLDSDHDYDKLLQVNKDTFLRVKEVKININDNNDIENVINEYGISPEMADDIRSLAKNLHKSDDASIEEMILYTPKKKIEANINGEAINIDGISSSGELDVDILVSGSDAYETRYYVGHNGQRYYDEVYYYYGVSGYKDIKTGSAIKNYFTTVFYNLCELGIGSFVDTLTGGSYSLVQCFGNVITTYPTSSGDLWQTNNNEEKYRKYTSIHDGSNSSWPYAIKAVSEISRQYFDHFLYFHSINKRLEYADSWEYYELPNYYSLDKKAYEYRNSTNAYRELISGYRPGKSLTLFKSINN